MNPALSDVFLANLPKAICQTYEPICTKQLNTVFLHMFNWFIEKYGKTTTEDSSTSACASSSDVGCAPRSTKI